MKIDRKSNLILNRFLLYYLIYDRIMCPDSNNLVPELQGYIQLLQYYRANVFKSDLFVQDNQS
jgi:hypothetical protein